MREIKFRALKSGCWYYLILKHPAGIAKALLKQWESGEEVVFETPWSQYTGIKDKNGKEIFEGDIVKNQFGSIGVVEYFTKLTWDSGGSDHPGFYCREWFYMGYEDELDYSEGFNDRIEVIGNIYENKELLERE